MTIFVHHELSVLERDQRLDQAQHEDARPESGVAACADGWLRAGGPHHQVLNPGHRADDWRMFCAEAGIELVVV